MKRQIKDNKVLREKINENTELKKQIKDNKVSGNKDKIKIKLEFDPERQSTLRTILQFIG